MRTRRVHETQKLATLADGTLRLTMTVGNLTELSSWVLGWGKTAKVIEPESLATQLRLELSKALAKYDTPSKGLKVGARPTA